MVGNERWIKYRIIAFTIMKYLCIWLSFALVLTCIMSSSVRVSASSSDTRGKSEKELREYANENDTWVVCYQQGKRTHNFYQYDATNECLYFSYSENSCVDVYDMNGVFLYSFLFPDRQNGAVGVRCENNQTYISTKDNILYIFEGIEEIDHMDYDEASEKGYDFFWFYNNEPHITVDNTWIQWHGSSGEIARQIKTPTVIKQTVPFPSTMSIFKLFVAAFVVLLIPVVKSVIKNVKKEVEM